MEVITDNSNIIFCALVILRGLLGTTAIMRCDTPNKSLVGPSSFSPGMLWPNGKVTYELHSSLTSVDVKEVMHAIYHIQSKTCIRFVPRAGNQSSYVSIEHDDNVCGMVSDFCCTGGFQFAKFGDVCKRWSVMVHELGHVLCLRHEMERKDRDEYVDFPNCPEDQIPEKDDLETRGYFYDYASQMAYECSWCGGGFIKMEGVSYCGMDVQEGLSVMDADKLNDLFDCDECFSHRWRRTENLTENEKGQLLSFGRNIEYKEFYLCRTYVGPGEIAPGQYNLENNTCTVTFNGRVFQVKDKVQVFTVPDENARKGYVMSKSKDYLVPVGRTALAVTIYAALADFNEYKGRHVHVIGKVYADDFCNAYFSIGNVEVTKTSFSILGCN